MTQLPAWSLPLIVTAITVPIVAGFLIAGPPLGLAIGAIAAATVIVIAARQRPREPIQANRSGDQAEHILVVLSRPVESAAAVEAISDAADAGALDTEGEILVLAPARSGFLDKWATDVRRARDEAQRNLVISVASLARANLEARAAVGDPDLVQAVEDSLGSFPATRVILATGPPGEDRDGTRAAAELERRLEIPFQRLTLA